MTCNNIFDLLVGVTHGKYIVAEYIRDRSILSQRPIGQLRKIVMGMPRWKGECGVRISCFFHVHFMSPRPALYIMSSHSSFEG